MTAGIGRLGAETIEYDEKCPLETKIAHMRHSNLTSEEYDEREKALNEEMAKMDEKYKDLEDIDCSYRGTYTLPEDVTYLEMMDRLKVIGATDRDLKEMHICFCCEAKLPEPKPYYLSDNLHLRASYLRTSDMGSKENRSKEDKKKDAYWDKKADAEELELSDTLTRLRSEGKIIKIKSRFDGSETEYELLSIGLINECNKCGNQPSFLKSLDMVVPEPYYKIENKRASNGRSLLGAMTYNEATDEIINRLCISDMPEGFRHVSSLNDCELYAKLAKREQKKMFDGILARMDKKKKEKEEDNVHARKRKT